MRPRLALLLAPIALWGCVDEPTAPLLPERSPVAALLDAARGGGPAGFYFLTPIAPALSAYPGVFDGSLSPVVEICRWSGSACTGAPVARYTLTEGTGGVLLRVVLAGEHYRVDWPVTGLPRGQLHRIRVLLDDAELGYADAQVPDVGQTATQLVAQGIVPLGNSSRLAIRFRLEEGVGDEDDEPEPVTPRQAALVSVRDRMQELEGQGLAGSALNAALVQFIASQPDFAAAGLDENGTSVWGRFTDGRLLIIPINWIDPAQASQMAAAQAEAERVRRLLEVLDQPVLPRLAGGQPAASPFDHPRARPSAFVAPSPAASFGVEPVPVRLASASAAFVPAPRQSQIGELPQSRQVRLHVGIPHRTLPNGDQEQLDAFYTFTEMIGQMLETVGYEATGGVDGSIEALRQVEGDGVFFFLSHGGGGSTATGQTVYAVQTTSAVVFGVDDTDVLYADDLNANRVVYMLTHNGIRTASGLPVREFFYGITDAFVSEYMEFDDAMVIINTCGSASPAAEEFSTAVLAAGAAVYFGWTGEAITPANSILAVVRFVDRLIGTNIDDAFREDPPQRPFDWPAVLTWMRGAGLNNDGATGAELTPFVSPLTLPLTQLAPSIMMVNVNEDTDQIFIAGLFGSNPCEGGMPPCADGSVTIDDVPLTVTDWAPTFIVADVPRSGEAASGDVVVTVRDHPSNVRRLVEWSGTYTYDHDDLGSLSLVVTINLRGRGDPGPIRQLPGDAPESVLSPIMDPMRSATGSFQAGGSLDVPQGDCTMRETWSGSGSIPSEIEAENLLSGIFFHFAEFDYMAETAAFHVRFGVPVRAEFDVIGGEDCFGHQEVTALFFADNAAYDGGGVTTSGVYNVQTTDGMTIPGGNRTYSVMGRNHIQSGNATVNVSWSTIGAQPELDAEMEF